MLTFHLRHAKATSVLTKLSTHQRAQRLRLKCRAAKITVKLNNDPRVLEKHICLQSASFIISYSSSWPVQEGNLFPLLQICPCCRVTARAHCTSYVLALNVCTYCPSYVRALTGCVAYYSSYLCCIHQPRDLLVLGTWFYEHSGLVYNIMLSLHLVSIPLADSQ